MKRYKKQEMLQSITMLKKANDADENCDAYIITLSCYNKNSDGILYS